MEKRGFLIGGALAVLAALGLYITVCLGFWVLSSGRVYPLVSVAGVDLSGKNKTEALSTLKKVEAPKKVVISGSEVKAADIELKYDYPGSVSEALLLGQDNPFILGQKSSLNLKVSYNATKLERVLRNIEKTMQKAVINPKTDGRELVEGQSGIRLNYAETATSLKEAVGARRAVVEASFYEVEPVYQAAELSKTAEGISELLPEELLLKSASQEFVVNKAGIFSWISDRTKQTSLALRFRGEPLLDPLYGVSASRFNASEIESYLMGLAPKINESPVNARLKAENGKVVVAQAEKFGEELNISESATAISETLESLNTSEVKAEVKLAVDVKKPEIRGDNLEELGLKELVSVGYSNFSGSPVNRIHNVRTGASKFNGVIVKPGEIFSFNTILGPVDASTGYKPELVILENKTQPQFGGGLCQVSSTAFRAALNAGFPILERRAHAYPVSYYKPFGVDATIYLPKPDFRFRNDSTGHILIQTRIVGKNLYFDFYGTKPARTVKFAGNSNGAGAVPIVERVSPYIYDQGKRGNRSFTAMFYRFIYDASGKLVNSKYFISKYDSPDKYPH